MQPPPASAAAGAAAPSAAAASTAAGAAAPSAAAGAAAAGGKGCGKRSRGVYIETRQCHVCGQHGHLQQSCLSCQAVDMQRRSSCGSLGTDMQKAELIQKSAEPLPIRHNGDIRWQNDSYGSGCEGMAAAAATATVTALTACHCYNCGKETVPPHHAGECLEPPTVPPHQFRSRPVPGGAAVVAGTS